MTNKQILKIFRGKNFMTPTPIQYFRAKVKDRVAYVELSKGMGLSGNTIYGVTFRRADGGELWREDPDWDPSGCFNSLQNAKDTIAEFGGKPL